MEVQRWEAKVAPIATRDGVGGRDEVAAKNTVATVQAIRHVEAVDENESRKKRRRADESVGRIQGLT